MQVFQEDTSHSLRFLHGGQIFGGRVLRQAIYASERLGVDLSIFLQLLQKIND
jgi:hypothetical protein